MIRIHRARNPISNFAEALIEPHAGVVGADIGLVSGFAQDAIIREFDDPYLELIRLLRETTEIEHALMVQYLYAGFSIRSQYAPVFGAAFAGAKSLLGVAIQEMQHLNMVSNVLLALGGTPNLVSQDFPYDTDIYPFPLHLQRLTRESVAKYVYTEAPAGAVTPIPGTPDPFLDALYRILGSRPPNHLGSVYGAIISLLEDVIKAPPFPLPDMALHLQNLQSIKTQGEGPHFEFFKSLFMATHSSFQSNPKVWDLPLDDPDYPSLPVPDDPSVLEQDPTTISDKVSFSMGRLGNLHYWAVLQLLNLSYCTGKPDYMGLAKNHMTGPLFYLGKTLASRRHGMPFDPPDLGYNTGMNEPASINIVITLLNEAGRVAESLRGDLPSDFPYDTVPSSIQQLKSLGRT